MIKRTLENTTEPSTGKSITTVFAAQLVSMAASVVMSLVVPKLLGVQEYALWQTFILYTGYSGLLVFGVNDGMLLRIGGKRYGEVPISELVGEFLILAIAQAVMAIILLLGSLRVFDEPLKYAMAAVCIYTPVYNCCCFLQYFFQAINHADFYAKSSNINRALFLGLLVLLIVLGCSTYFPYVIAYTIACVASLAYCILSIPKATTKCNDLRKLLNTIRIDAVSGLSVMVAFYAGTLILGSNRMMVQWGVGSQEFGYLSFASSLTTFALTFVAQAGIVFFPLFKRKGKGGTTKWSAALENVLSFFTPTLYLGYMGVVALVFFWLPNYSSALNYLLVLYPAMIWDIKMNLLYTPLIKAIREERVLAIINTGALLLSVVGSAVIMFVIRNVMLAVAFAAFSVFIRCAFTRMLLQKKKILPDIGGQQILEMISTILFIVSYLSLGIRHAIIMNLIYIIVFYALNMKKIIHLIKVFKKIDG